MRLCHLSVAAASAALLGFGLRANAQAVTTFSSAPVTDANAIFDDINLTGRVQNIMSVSVGANDWTGSSIRITLDTGTVYNATNGAAATDSQPSPGSWTSVGTRNGPYDTFVNSKGTGVPNPDTQPTMAFLLGSTNPDGSSGPPPAVGLTTTGATLVSAQWGNIFATDTGTFSVGRFTLSTNATGTFIGSSVENATNVPVAFSGTIAGGVMTITPIPEPACIGLLSLAALALSVRRRRA
jgi:hypothetical protein